jgi:hypothetical protein
MAEAIWAARGRIFSDRSEDSARTSCIPPTRRIGRIATPMTMMPMPPSHCRIARQRRIPGGAVSSPMITVEPVVVIPEVASKIASATLRSSSENANGRALKPHVTAQTMVTRRKACLPLSSSTPRTRFMSRRLTPANSVTLPAARKTCQSAWPAARSATIGGAMNRARMISRMPTTRKIGRQSITSASGRLDHFPGRCNHLPPGATARS